MKEILQGDLREVSEQLAHAHDAQERAELGQIQDSLHKSLGGNPDVPYALLGTTGEEVFEAVDLEPKLLSRQPRIIYGKGEHGRTA